MNALVESVASSALCSKWKRRDTKRRRMKSVLVERYRSISRGAANVRRHERICSVFVKVEWSEKPSNDRTEEVIRMGFGSCR